MVIATIAARRAIPTRTETRARRRGRTGSTLDAVDGCHLALWPRSARRSHRDVVDAQRPGHRSARDRGAARPLQAEHGGGTDDQARQTVVPSGPHGELLRPLPVVPCEPDPSSSTSSVRPVIAAHGPTDWRASGRAPLRHNEIQPTQTSPKMRAVISPGGADATGQGGPHCRRVARGPGRREQERFP